MLELKNIKKDYITGDIVTHALKGISLTLRDSEFVSILGPSGCGKTTTLNIVGGLDRYTEGDLFIEGKSTKEYTDKDWDAYRNHKVGFVFQSYNLIPHQNILSNVEMALTIGGVDQKRREEMAIEALTKVGLESEIHKMPQQLSGGQMQRVAIARALVNKPQVLLADEPTGALDSVTSVQVLDLLKELSKECLVVMVTHNEDLAEKYSTRIITLKDGEMTGDSNPYNPTEDEIKESEAKEEENNKQYLDKKGKMKRVGMPFWTAFKLSLSNLKSKIGRTILTCFAGSIGIIGIALVLSVSNGFDHYIQQVETSTLSEYPVELSNQSLDMTALFASFLASTRATSKKQATENVTPNWVFVDLLKSIASSSKTNDLHSFRKYIEEEEHKKELMKYATHITYEYGTKLYAYDATRKNQDGNFEIRMVEPFTLPPNKEGEDPYYVYSPSFGKSTMEGYMRNLTIWDELYDDGDSSDGLVSDVLMNQYNLKAGKWPESYDEAIIVVDENNQITDSTLYALGLADDDQGRDVGDEYIYAIFDYVNDPENNPSPSDNPKYNEYFNWTYEELLESEYYILPQSSMYKKDSTSITVDTYSFISDEDLMDLFNDYENNDIVRLKVVGVVQPNPNSDTHSIGGALGYTSALTDYLNTVNNDSEIVAYQNANPDYCLTDYYISGTKVGGKGSKYSDIRETIRVMLGESFYNTYTEEYLRSQQLRSYGYRDLEQPSSIKIYPKDFEAKDKIIEFIDHYNAQVDDESKKISYTDYVGTIMGSVTTIVNAVTYVLVAFVSISLIVSSIMIAIITYISVLERTKEIGILRAMGASKRDVKNIFNAETFITGFISGVLGVVIAIILDIPISLIIFSLAGIKNIAALPWLGGVSLVIISFLLSVISGLIPASYAAKCDPVVALRSE